MTTNQENIAMLTATIIASNLQLTTAEERARIVPSARFDDDLGMDSLEISYLIICIEDELGVEIPDDKAADMKTVADLTAFLDTQVEAIRLPEMAS